MQTLSATDLAIAVALQSNTLKLEPGVGRFGDAYWAISDDHGLIEVSMGGTGPLNERLAAVKNAMAD